MKICAEIFDARAARYCVLVHGGAGAWSSELRSEGVRGSERAALAASAELERGASALDAVQRAVELMERRSDLQRRHRREPHARRRARARRVDHGRRRAPRGCRGGARRVPKSGERRARGARRRAARPLRRARVRTRSRLDAASSGVEPAVMITERARERLAKAVASERPREGDTVGAVAFDSEGGACGCHEHGRDHGKTRRAGWGTARSPVQGATPTTSSARPLRPGTERGSCASSSRFECSRTPSETDSARARARRSASCSRAPDAHGGLIAISARRRAVLGALHRRHALGLYATRGRRDERRVNLRGSPAATSPCAMTRGSRTRNDDDPNDT